MVSGEIPRETQYIMFNLPPQHGKSMHISETFPSYFLGTFPNEGCILVSYDDTFAAQFGGKNRDKISEHGADLFGLSIPSDTRSKTDWGLQDSKTGQKYRGGMISRGIMAGITGSSLGDCIIIDDPVKNRQEANSAATRESIWLEWKDTIRTRIHPGAIVILVMTRWHEDDLAGRLLNTEYGVPLPWKVYNLPLEAEENDLLGRRIGEPLWPERYGYDFIRECKAYPDTYNSLYQGRPTTPEGNMIKKAWWKHYDTLPVMVYEILSVDASFKDTSGSAKCSIQVWGKRGANYYLIDNDTRRMDFVATIQATKNMLGKHKGIRGKLVEDKANGPAIISVLNREIGGFIPISADSSTGGKEARVQAITPYIEAGNVFLPRDAPWVKEFVEECASFPKGKYKDQVDAMSQALNRLITYSKAIPQERQAHYNFPSEKPPAGILGTVTESFFKDGWL